MELNGIELFAQAIQRIVEYPFQRIWAVYLNYNSLVKEGQMSDGTSQSLVGSWRSITEREFKFLFRHVDIQVITGVGLPVLQYMNAIACEEICWQIESDTLKQLFRTASVLITIAISYPINMLQFRWLVDTSDSPEAAFAGIRSIKEFDGLLGFFDGCLPTLVGSFLYKLLHSITAVSLWPLMEVCGRDANDTTGMFIVGYLSAAIANVTLYPIDYLRRRMVIFKKSRVKNEKNDDFFEQTGEGSGSSWVNSMFKGTMLGFGKSICEEEGWKTLWDGCWAAMGISTLKTVVFVVIQTLTH